MQGAEGMASCAIGRVNLLNAQLHQSRWKPSQTRGRVRLTGVTFTRPCRRDGGDP